MSITKHHQFQELIDINVVISQFLRQTLRFLRVVGELNQFTKICAGQFVETRLKFCAGFQLFFKQNPQFYPWQQVLDVLDQTIQSSGEFWCGWLKK
jgi:hypothetical protein